ncbi:hypothetical protein GLOTRDRAFT_94324 [Gloeophyllum trabeum ATCC 11539]|uniref:Uncharacterized protein n=1 Tax=Gloeophyllum trabeum (strain ATCC 11539 / FP-39264 / Madison 617) TaxID=670483 RepID=S7RMI2_GLOTA|nr:uncharacterized protein GLOTRDRAFT_94324 [Gloeophyllum trabeum ATCC 11539]EPQ53899.1 hypothetical protein GLOTRDRAFT_94324 [Gloeophyllum trabeum ATCC 11539]
MVRDPDAACTYLIESKYVIEMEEILLGRLLSILLDAIKDTCNTCTEIVQAVAYLLKDEETSEMTKAICNTMGQWIKVLEHAALMKINEMLENITSQTRAHAKALEKGESTAPSHREEILS